MTKLKKTVSLITIVISLTGWSVGGIKSSNDIYIRNKQINGEQKIVRTTKKVLTTINETIGSNTVASKPFEVFDNGEMNYFYTLKINNVPNADKFSESDTIEITPFWTYYSSNADSQERLVGTTKVYNLQKLLK